MIHTLNNKMFQKNLELIGKKVKLSKSLLKILSNGFTTKNGCYFLTTLLNMQKSTTIEDFSDQTAYECFVNSMHLDDYVQSDYLVQGYLLVGALIKKWNGSKNKKGLNIVCILSETEFGANFRFHVKRKNENWIDADDIENFSEPIIIITN